MNIHPSWSIDHIGIAVDDLNAAVELYCARLGATVTLREKLEEQGVEIAFIGGGATKVELLAPLREGTTLSKFLARRGAGLHHIGYRVANIKEELARLAQAGCVLIDSTPRPGAAGSQIAFISPKSFMGVLTELVQSQTP